MAYKVITAHLISTQIDKLVEIFEENKKLYEQHLASEREKLELLKNQLH